jgi:ethanolamine utilization protein EutA (predicted chaperonin)
MKLVIRKEQSKKMMGGISFVLHAQVDLTDEELDLVHKYKAYKQVLMNKQLKIPFTSKTLSLNITIGSLINGQTFNCNDIGEILEYENSVKESCESFKNYIEVMASFGGEEIIEFN